MKTQKQLFLQSFSNIKLDSNKFYHCYEGETWSMDYQNIDHEDENFVIKVRFDEEVRWTDSSNYEFNELYISELNVYDKGGNELFIDVSDKEMLNALDY